MRRAGRTRPRLPLIDRYLRPKGLQANFVEVQRRLRELDLASREGGTVNVVRVQGSGGVGGGVGVHDLLSATHPDTLAAGVVDGDVAIGNLTPAWSRLPIAIPAANVRNVLGVDNGELRPSWKALLDGVNPANIAAAASPGTSLFAPHRDHIHAHPDIASDLHSVYLLASGGRAHAGNFDFGAFYQDIGEIAVPANPGANIRRLFVDAATGEISVRTAAGATISLEGGGGGAPTAAPYITYGTDAGLSNEFSVKSTDLAQDFGGADLRWRFADFIATRRFIVEHTNLGKVSIDVINPTLLVGPYHVLHGFFGAEANPRIRLTLPAVAGQPALDFGPGSAVPDVRLERFSTKSLRVATTGGLQAGLAFRTTGGDLATPTSGHIVNYAKSFAAQPRAFYRGADGLVFGPLGTPAATIIFQRGQKGEWSAPADTAANFAAGGWGLLANLQSIGALTMGDGIDGHFITATSGAAIGNDGGFYTTAVCVRSSVVPSLRGPAFQVKFRPPTITNIRMFIGLSTQSLATMVGADNPAGDYAGLQFSTPRGDANWQAVSKDNTTQDLQDSGIAGATTVFTFRVEFDGVNFLWTLLSATYTVLATGTFAINPPRTNQDMRLIVGYETRTAATRSIEFFWGGLLAPNI